MGFSSSWSVESKEFELVVVGGESGVRVRECCKGKKRSILLNRDELAWLVRIFEDLVLLQIGSRNHLIFSLNSFTIKNW
jgi:hypothetical protein